MGSPQVLAGKCVSNPRFEAGYHMSTTLLVLKSFLNFLQVNEPGEKSEKTGKKGNRLPSNEEKLRAIQ